MPDVNTYEDFIASLDIPTMTLEQVRELQSLQDRHLYNCFPDVRVRMAGKDFGDHYFIIEDLRPEQTQHHFLLYLEDSGGVLNEHQQYDTMIEAMLWYANRFVLDNCDGADSTNPEIVARHSRYQTTLRDLIE